MNRQAFLKPDNVYGGVALWMLNDRLEVDQVLRQLDELAAAGWGAVIARTFNGLLTPYLGEAWMEIIGQIITRAEQLGVRVWLQAGYMPGAVPGLNPAHAHRGLRRRPLNEPAAAGETRLASDDAHVYYEYLAESVLDLLDRDAVTNYLNLAYRDPWYSRFSAHFGKTIEAIWVDEPHFRPPLLPWSRRLPDTFRDQWGYDLREHLPSLFREVGDYRRVRYHYWRCVLGLFLKGYFEPVSDWCTAHGVKFSGHLMGEDTLNNQIGWTAATMPCYQHMHLPGIDHLTGSLNWPTGKPFILTPKQVTSAANQLGKTEVLAEMYGVSTSGISFAHRKQIADWMMVLGINYRCYHGAFYSMRGRRKRIYVPHLSYQQPWWPDNRLISDPFARLAWALRQGRSMAQVLVLHPVESAWCLFDPASMQRPHSHDGETTDLVAMDDRLAGLCRELLGIQRDFDLGDESLLAEHGSAGPEGLRVGQMTYRIVILPDLLTIRHTTLALLEAFSAAGGVVLSAGRMPDRVNGIESPDGAKRLAALLHPPAPLPSDSEGLRQALATASPALLEVHPTRGAAADLWVQVRQVEGGRLVFITNINAEQAFAGTLTLAEQGELEDWDLASGRVEPAVNTPFGNGLQVPLDLPPLGSRLLRLCEGRPTRAVSAPRWTTVERTPLPEHGRIERDSPNVLTLDVCRWRKGDNQWSDPTPVRFVQNQLEAEKYTGPVTLQFQFQTGVNLPDLRVAIEDAAEYAIQVNGQTARYEGLPYYVDRSFHPVALDRFVQQGQNTIELTREFRPIGKSVIPLAALFEAREGTELESIYLIGDFAVRGALSAAPPRPDCVRFAPGFTLTKETRHGSARFVSEGYPFYAGRITHVRTVTLRAPAVGERVMLELTGIDAALARVRVNGQDVGALPWPPYELEVGQHLVEGENEIAIELVGTLRNLLGPHHRESGEPSHTWHVSFENPPDHGRRTHSDDAIPAWTDDYFVTRFGILGAVHLCYQQEETQTR